MAITMTEHSQQCLGCEADLRTPKIRHTVREIDKSNDVNTREKLTIKMKKVYEEKGI